RDCDRVRPPPRVAHVPDTRRRRADQRAAPRAHCGLLELVIADERADAEPSVLADDVAQQQSVDVDHDPGPRESIVKDRDQALAAREHLGLVAVLAEQPERLIECLRRRVLERMHQRRCSGSSPYRARPRMEAGWPGSLSFLPVSVILVPSTLRMDTSRSV